MDDFALQILPYTDDLPIVEEEIGDTWIHGVGTDPLKVSRYRALCRFIAAEEHSVLCNEKSAQLKEMKQKLLLIPEHTWGMDLKRYLPDYLNYRKEDFLKAKLDDIIPRSVQEEGQRNYLPQKETDDNHVQLSGIRSYREFESSWKEQRDYLEKSLVCLNGSNLRLKAEAALREVEPRWISSSDSGSDGFREIDLKSPVSFGRWVGHFSMQTGALISLFHRDLAIDICRQGGSLGLYRYEIYSDKEYQQFYEKYILKEGDHHNWSLPDYTKPGLSRLTDLIHYIYHPVEPIGFYFEREDELELRIYTRMPREAWGNFGSPRELLTRYQLRKDNDAVTVTLHWQGKDANRIPESSWIEFDPAVDDSCDCYLDKMGLSLSSQRVTKNGNRSMHAVDSGVRITSENFQIELLTRDVPLVSVGQPRILDFDQRSPLCSEGIYFNLHNNLWGTNFPMWYDDNGMFEFTIKVRSNS